MTAWTLKYMVWVKQVCFRDAAQEYTRLDCLHEVEHMGERVRRLEQAITEAVELAPAPMQAVIISAFAFRLCCYRSLLRTQRFRPGADGPDEAQGLTHPMQ